MTLTFNTLKMKETQEILLQMGFENPNSNVWESDWFGVFLLAKTATPAELSRFIYDRGFRHGKDVVSTND